MYIRLFLVILAFVTCIHCDDSSEQEVEALEQRVRDLEEMVKSLEDRMTGRKKCLCCPGNVI